MTHNAKGRSPTAGPGDLEPVRESVTIKTLRRMSAAGTPFACLTCYDATTARWLERAGVHVLLVGDSAAEVILGLRRTIDMPLDVSLALTAAVKRGAPHTVVMGDMPFMSYQASEDQALLNAGRYLTEGLADIVKIEVDETYASLVRRMSHAGIPVCAHVGSLPQHSAMNGGYGPAGRTAFDAERIVRDARAMEAAGAVMLLVEAVPDEVTRRILDATSIPLIGIGAGGACHGQVLVLQDLVGLTEGVPRFAEPVAQIGAAIQQAALQWVQRVADRDIGGRRYTMPTDEAERLRIRDRRSDGLNEAADPAVHRPKAGENLPA